MTGGILHLIANRSRVVALVSTAVFVGAFAVGSTLIPRMEARAVQFADLSSESRTANQEVEQRTGVEADTGVLAVVSGEPAAVARVLARIHHPAVNLGNAPVATTGRRGG